MNNRLLYTAIIFAGTFFLANAQRLKSRLPGSFCRIQIARSIDSKATIANTTYKFGRIVQYNFDWFDDAPNAHVTYSRFSDAYFLTSLVNDTLYVRKYSEGGLVLESTKIYHPNYVNSFFIRPKTKGGAAVVLFSRFDIGGSFTFSSILMEFDDKLNRKDSLYFHDKKIDVLEYLPSGDYCLVQDSSIQRYSANHVMRFSLPLTMANTSIAPSQFSFNETNFTVSFIGPPYELLVNRYDYYGTLLWSWSGGLTSFGGASVFFLNKIENRPELLFVQTVPDLGNGTFDAWTKVWIIGEKGDTISYYYYNKKNIQSIWANANYFLFSEYCNIWEQGIKLPKLSPKVTIYPNPATDFIIIEVPFDEDASAYSYSIFNQSGTLVRNVAGPGPAFISLSSLRAGLYLIRVDFGHGKVHHEKIIKL